MAFALSRSADFAIDKPAGQPCPHLAADRCSIHDELPARGFRGCAAFHCLGAGPRATAMTANPVEREAVFHALRGLHELLWLLDAALAIPAAASLHGEVRDAIARLDGIDPAKLDLGAERARSNVLLTRVSALARSGPDYRGRDLAGADLAGADLRGASLRGALLLGADLRGADLRGADFTGADLRGADLRGADLTGALFLQPGQLASAVR